MEQHEVFTGDAVQYASVKKFIEQGLSKLKAFLDVVKRERVHTTYVIGVSWDAYIRLLADAYFGVPLFTGHRNGTNRPVEYIKSQCLIKASADNRIVVILEWAHDASICKVNPQGLSQYELELRKRLKEGRDLDIFRYDDKGHYLGSEINGKIVAPEHLDKPP